MITDIHLRNFRSYGDESFEFSQSVNIIVGPNGSGKTNLLEAILVLMRGSSYRAKDIELIKINKPWSRLDSHTQNNDSRVVKLSRREISADKEFQLNNQTFRRLSLQRSLPVVLFEPNHLRILSDSPELRRQYLDNLLSQTQLVFGAQLRAYKRTLQQRNALLKKIRHHPTLDQIFAWNLRLSELGEKIALARQQLVKDINNDLQRIYTSLAKNKQEVSANYKSTADPKNYATELLQKLESSLDADVERGFTSHGPHREDLVLKFGDHLVQETASRGELRTLVLALKIIEAMMMEKVRGRKPMLLFDDVFSELDGAHRQALTKFIQPYQVFITTTDADVVIQHFTESTNIIPLR